MIMENPRPIPDGAEERSVLDYTGPSSVSKELWLRELRLVNLVGRGKSWNGRLLYKERPESDTSG